MKVLLKSLMILFIFLSFKKANQNTKDVVIKKITITNDHCVPHTPQLQILHLSDLHLENISISPQELYEKVKDESIDMIVITGDFLDRKRTIPKLVSYLSALNQLKPPYGMYAVLGNHDYVLKNNHLDQLIQTLEQHHCHVLRNEHITIEVKGQPVHIIGIDDFSTKRSNLASSYQGITSGYQLVLTHDPNIVLHMKDYHFDYLLAGHFHGGQICYPHAYHLVKMGKLARKKIIKGLHFLDGKPFYISEGLGQTGINIRVGSRPEITIHQLGLPQAN